MAKSLLAIARQAKRAAKKHSHNDLKSWWRKNGFDKLGNDCKNFTPTAEPQRIVDVKTIHDIYQNMVSMVDGDNNNGKRGTTRTRKNDRLFNSSLQASARKAWENEHGNVPYSHRKQFVASAIDAGNEQREQKLSCESQQLPLFELHPNSPKYNAGVEVKPSIAES